jgi:hypothetical protein
MELNNNDDSLVIRQSLLVSSAARPLNILNSMGFDSEQSGGGLQNNQLSPSQSIGEGD